MSSKSATKFHLRIAATMSNNNDNTSSEGNTDGDTGAFQAFKIEPKNEEEVEHQKQGMPKDCAYAMAAMLHNNHVEVAKRCSLCLNETLEILAAGPTDNRS